MQKLSVLLGLRDKIEKTFAQMLDDMFGKFKGKQGLFKGEQRTYQALEGYADDPTKRGYKLVASTVDEQLDYFANETKDYFHTIFSIEKTNSTGIKADLVVDGVNWGSYSTLELLRLKSILDGKIRDMLKELPVRDEAVIWKKSSNENYEGKNVYESPTDEGFSKTTLKRVEIVNDPHIKDSPNRPPVPQQIDTQVNIGKYTAQVFSGELSMKERADKITKYDKLYRAVIAALGDANNTDGVESDLGDKVLEYLF